MQNLILDGHKLLWHKERVEAWLAGERIAPVTIDCALTRRCTYKCVYCYGQLQANDEQHITRDVLYRFLDDAAEIGVKAVSFVSDGESTCSPYLYDTILRGKSNGLDIALGTNGYLLKDERLEEILPCLTYLRFNISAGEPAAYAQIMGCPEKCFHKVCQTIRNCVEIKKKKGLTVTLGLQMVLIPELAGQIMPFAELGKELSVDYAVIKHCSDDEKHSLGVNYAGYFELIDKLKEVENYSTQNYLVKVKWSKILSGGERSYTRCLGPAFIMQFSGSGLVAPCGMLFNHRFRDFHIGNIAQTSFKTLWQGKRYGDVLDYLASDKFNAQTDCGSLCLQHKVNEFLWDIKTGRASLQSPLSQAPEHINFI